MRQQDGNSQPAALAGAHRGPARPGHAGGSATTRPPSEAAVQRESPGVQGGRHAGCGQPGAAHRRACARSWPPWPPALRCAATTLRDALLRVPAQRLGRPRRATATSAWPTSRAMSSAWPRSRSSSRLNVADRAYFRKAVSRRCSSPWANTSWGVSRANASSVSACPSTTTADALVGVAFTTVDLVPAAEKLAGLVPARFAMHVDFTNAEGILLLMSSRTGRRTRSVQPIQQEGSAQPPCVAGISRQPGSARCAGRANGCTNSCL